MSYFAELVLIPTPFFPLLWGKRIDTILQDLFCYHSNLFSFEHIHFAEVNGEKAGMILGYGWEIKERENLRTGSLLFKKMGISISGKLLLLAKFNKAIGKLYNGEYYISNIATYPRYRGMGAGKRLMLEAENEAEKIGARRTVLDVESDNISTIAFYQKLGYEIKNEFSVTLQKGKTLHFNRMIKEI